MNCDLRAPNDKNLRVIVASPAHLDNVRETSAGLIETVSPPCSSEKSISSIDCSYAPDYCQKSLNGLAQGHHALQCAAETADTPSWLGLLCAGRKRNRGRRPNNSSDEIASLHGCPQGSGCTILLT